MTSTVATSLKLPVELKAAIDDDAKKQGLTSHAWMVKALTDVAQRARQREQFTQDAQDALHDFQATGMGHALDDVRAHFAQMAAFRAGQGPRPAPLAAKKCR